MTDLGPSQEAPQKQEAQQAFDAFAAIPPRRAGIFCDFDGTLAQIVSDPDHARPEPGVTEVLASLVTTFAVVAVVSGRGAADVASRLSVPGVAVIGLHGLEQIQDGRVVQEPGFDEMASRVARAADLIERESLAGVVVERKGLAIAVHFRRATDPDAAQSAMGPLIDAAAASLGLSVLPGRRILEVRPASGPDKGDAVLRIGQGMSLQGVLFAGDDAGDLPAFAAARRFEASLCIGVAGPESPKDLRDAADLLVDGPAGVVRMLERVRVLAG